MKIDMCHDVETALYCIMRGDRPITGNRDWGFYILWELEMCVVDFCLCSFLQPC